MNEYKVTLRRRFANQWAGTIAWDEGSMGFVAAVPGDGPIIAEWTRDAFTRCDNPEMVDAIRDAIADRELGA